LSGEGTMELDERLKDEIAAIFKLVKHGSIKFYISPEKKTLEYSIENKGNLSICKLERFST
jgi:hypothetical protein